MRGHPHESNLKKGMRMHVCVVVLQWNQIEFRDKLHLIRDIHIIFCLNFNRDNLTFVISNFAMSISSMLYIVFLISFNSKTNEDVTPAN